VPASAHQLAAALLRQPHGRYPGPARACGRTEFGYLVSIYVDGAVMDTVLGDDANQKDDSTIERIISALAAWSLI
jgi:hypothetical protein